MGSPLSPILADIVLQDIEERSLSSLTLNLPLYIRYVDDIAMAAPSSLISQILHTFNSHHKRIQFTIELPDYDQLNFLDVSLIINNQHLEFNWYQKLTFSGRLLNFHSQHPVVHKKGVIIGLVDKVFKLSHPRFHEQNLTRVINILLDNSYPLNFIFRVVSCRLKSLIYKSNAPDHSPSLSLPPSFFTIPFIKNLSHKFLPIAHNLNKCLAFTVGNKLNKIIKRHKDALPVLSHSDVVYKLSCNSCDASYIGQTKRQLNTRVVEHRRNISLHHDRLNVVSIHRLENSHEFDWDNVQVLDHESSYKKRLFSEMLHITLQPNALNIQSDTESLDRAYLPLIKNC